MPKSTVSAFLIAGALAAASAVCASAQTAAAATPPAAGEGLLGQNYVGLYEGYFRHNDGQPIVDHDYGFTYNQSVIAGIDAIADYDWLTGSAQAHDWRQQALFGATAYAPTPWGKPFVSGEIGWGWSTYNTLDRNGFTYRTTAGVEFQAAPALAFSPYAQYQQWHALAEPGWPGHDWNFGVKATYRLAQHWSVTLDPQVDQYHNADFQIGLNFHY